MAMGGINHNRVGSGGNQSVHTIHRVGGDTYSGGDAQTAQ